MATQIFLVRHGQTEWTLSGQHTGRTDLPLTKEGEGSVIRLRDQLQGIAFTHVLTSPLQRARQTCEQAGFGNIARVEANLREWDYGDYEGRTSADIRREQPGWNIFRDGCPHGESVELVTQRADRLLADLRELDGVIALFSHAHFLRVLTVRWIGLPAGVGQHFVLDPGSIGILSFEHANNEVPSISLWNSGPNVLKKAENVQ